VIAECSVDQLARLEKRRAMAGLALTLLSLITICYAIAHRRVEGEGLGTARAVESEH